MRWVALAVALGACAGPTDSSEVPLSSPPEEPDPSTCGATPESEWEYGADWTGVAGWLDDWCQGCHNPQGVAHWDIVRALEVQRAGGRTLDVQKILVVPGDPQRSLLWKVMWGAPGTQVMPDNAPALQDCTRRAHVEAWIGAGARIP